MYVCMHVPKYLENTEDTEIEKSTNMFLNSKTRTSIEFFDKVLINKLIKMDLINFLNPVSPRY